MHACFNSCMVMQWELTLWLYVALYSIKQSRCVCETLQYAPGGNKAQKAIFNVKVIRSLTLVSFERASLVEYACQIWSLFLLWFNVIAKVKVDNRQTNRRTGQK